jgi:hypothetical protein
MDDAGHVRYPACCCTSLLYVGNSAQVSLWLPLVMLDSLSLGGSFGHVAD